ncbi:bifunctional glutamate N-acetyltransferase/amino-acid acetyltransferase ArgJ [Bacillus horti]|uniref:Arginine biosynthesis bifunctional protein ArgJ n=1 Tax=Caldalkalibacillus horti TaxID=77523 RepID=A0ABT9VZY7_9BACI|nr:bifunctional glutamate N-acetyltransferase/amino-acid acetyltransferase ArgJ [Bacillus horti]MDQ0166541.1 glutamate N-acetyltransferase/amino-acid N-acetyltransferase [Bacillus horti]
MSTDDKDILDSTDTGIALQDAGHTEQDIKDGLSINLDGHVTSPLGYKAGGLHCGIKRKRHDLGWIISEVPAFTAGVYTTNLIQAAPLQVTKESLQVDGSLYAVLVNSGNANACTGMQGLEDAYEMRRMLAEQLEVEKHQVAVVSTGVIGELMPMDKISAGVKEMKEQVAQTTVLDFEKAILTTDTCTKHIAVECVIDGCKVTIGGAAKGSGMIHPNMATMLGFITTDATVEPAALDLALKHLTNKSFNRITVDGDTSTNDMVLLMANGLAKNDSLSPQHPQWDTFLAALELVCKDLAKKIARDGEGATKLIEVQVKGAESEQIAEAVGKSVVGSSLVKTAVYGTDPNWGRIVCAVGYTSELKSLDPNLLSVWLGEIQVVDNGLPVSFNEEEATLYLEQENVKIYVDLQMGSHEATCWGCDLSYDYVRINASYRT